MFCEIDGVLTVLAPNFEDNMLKYATLHETLRGALSDLDHVLASVNGIQVNMFGWVTKYKGVCRVCLAGAVMVANTPALEMLNNPNYQHLSIYPDFMEDVRNLKALSHLAFGNVVTAIEEFYPSIGNDKLHELYVDESVYRELSRAEYKSYAVDSEQWRKYMEQVLEFLTERNL